jgi:hypothetical protein
MLISDQKTAAHKEHIYRIRQWDHKKVKPYRWTEYFKKMHIHHQNHRKGSDDIETEVSFFRIGIYFKNRQHLEVHHLFFEKIIG